MLIRLRPSPFLDPIREDLLTDRETILQRIDQCGDMEWAKECVAVYMNGIFIPRAWWPYVTMKPEADGITEFVIVNQNNRVFPILASVALIALTAGIGTFGVPFLGAGFAAGTFGASAVGAGVGIAGQIALRALTAPQTVKNDAASARDLSQAGIGVNVVTKLQTLPVVEGLIRLSPPVISQSYTTLNNKEITVHAIVGAQGRNFIDNILLNGIDIAQFENIEYETREGGQSDLPLTLAQLTCIQQTEQVVISDFRTKQETSTFDELIDQVTPDNSTPNYHPFKTDGIADEIWIRLLCPSGLLRVSDGLACFVPIRIEIRKVGDSSWRNLPTLHIWDRDHGSGPFRAEVKIKFQKQPSGRHFSNANDQWPIFELTNITAIGQSFQYQSDAYFQHAASDYVGVLPIMTAATTSGVTMSASSEFAAGNAAWKAADGTGGSTYWRPTANSLPAWLKVDLGSAQTIRSYGLYSEAYVVQTTTPTLIYVEGSNDNSAWTLLDDEPIDVSDLPLGIMHMQIGNPGSYRYYRINFTGNNGAASEDLRISHLEMFTHDCYGSLVGQEAGFTFDGYFAKHSSGSDPRCLYGSLDSDGATFYLDPAQWLPGEYEVRIKRGWGQIESLLSPKAYTFNGSTTGCDFFEYFVSGGKYTVRFSPNLYRTDTVVEVFSTVSYDTPVDTTGIACIAIELKSIVINSISCEMMSYASIYSGGIWTDAETQTNNPAALYRRRKLGHAHPNPTDGEILDEDDLIDWYNRCNSAGHECNFVHQGRSIGDVLSTIAYTGYASPREANTSSIVQDYDRSAEPISQLLSPLNCRLLSNIVGLPDIEHAIIAQYLNEDDEYKVARETVYRDGYDAQTATFFVTIDYEGITNTSKVIARATFDIKQAIYRASLVKVEVDIEGFDFWRGKLVGHNDDTLYNKQATALIVSIQDDGVNITGITVDNVVPFSANQDDLEALMSGLDLSNATGVGIRLGDDTVIVKTLTNVIDSKVALFTTPFTIGSIEIEIGQLVVFGIATTTPYARMLVMEVEMQGFEKRVLTLAPEAPEIFA